MNVLGQRIHQTRALTILQLADEMTEDVAAKPETVGRIRKAFGEDGVVELMMTIAFYNLMTRLTDTSGVPLETP